MRIIRTALIVVVVVVGVYALSGSWNGGSWQRSGSSVPPVGTSGTLDPAKAREGAAELGKQVVIAGEKMQEGAHEAGITAKIKAKMALDDSVQARAVDVSTDGSTVTISGTVGSVAEHDRALALARETVGVSRVIDRLVVRVP